jgi:hypothetical protein
MLTSAITQQMVILFIEHWIQRFCSDVVLIYRMRGTIDATTHLATYSQNSFLPQGELDYDFDFSRKILRFMQEVLWLEVTPSYLNNQTFRIVIVPGSFSN